jgi:hypothetical protein
MLPSSFISAAEQVAALANMMIAVSHLFILFSCLLCESQKKTYVSDSGWACFMMPPEYLT